MTPLDKDIDDMQHIIEGKCSHCDKDETTDPSWHYDYCPKYIAWRKFMLDKQFMMRP